VPTPRALKLFLETDDIETADALETRLLAALEADGFAPERLPDAAAATTAPDHKAFETAALALSAAGVGLQVVTLAFFIDNWRARRREEKKAEAMDTRALGDSLDKLAKIVREAAKAQQPGRRLQVRVELEGCSIDLTSDPLEPLLETALRDPHSQG